jgi:putative flavoprotein involved in K+ transport
VTEKLDTIIVGGGQAGLAMSYHLRNRGREHLVLERSRTAERWHSERWNSLRFQYPNWSLELPGVPYVGNAPDRFAHYTEIAGFIRSYASKIDAPVRIESEVTNLRLAPGGIGYALETQAGTLEARSVVIATGPFQLAHRPDFAAFLPPGIYQTDAVQYRGPEQLPGGAVLVVGSGASGHQIADELLSNGRKVYFSLSRHRRVPRRWRGKDAFWWFKKTGRFDITIDSFPGRMYPPSTVVTGAEGGYDINARQFAMNGGKLLGRLKAVSGGTLQFGDDANQILEEADLAYEGLVDAANALIERPDFEENLPPEDMETQSRLLPVSTAETVSLNDANITSVIWCTGYRYDFNWIKLPVLDSSGAPIQTRGVTPCPGIYFLGLHWMHTFKSGQLSFVGEDAEFLADRMDAAG